MMEKRTRPASGAACWSTHAGGAFTQFVPTDEAPLTATASVALAMLAVGMLLQGAWFWTGTGLARLIAGHPAERWVMRALGVLTVASVVYALQPGLAGRPT